MNNLYHKIRGAIMRRFFKKLHLRPDSFPFVSGDGFRKISNHIYDDLEIFDPNNVKDNDIIFVQSNKIKEYFDNIHPYIKIPYKLITHNGDESVGEEEANYIDEKIICWFAQNNIFKHPKIVPIPIGIENKFWHLSGEALFKLYNKLNKNYSSRKNKILFGFNIKTNPLKRGPAIKALRENKSSEEITERLNPYDYIKKLNNYKFVASPEGNGVDCHRTWEALYLGITPIVEKSVATEYFKNIGFDIMIINSWDEINSKHIDLNQLNDTPQELLKFDYWYNKIKNA